MIYSFVKTISKYNRDRSSATRQLLDTQKRSIRQDITNAFDAALPLIRQYPETFEESYTFLDFLFKLCHIDLNTNESLKNIFEPERKIKQSTVSLERERKRLDKLHDDIQHMKDQITEHEQNTKDIQCVIPTSITQKYYESLNEREKNTDQLLEQVDSIKKDCAESIEKVKDLKRKRVSIALGDYNFPKENITPDILEPSSDINQNFDHQNELDRVSIEAMAKDSVMESLKKSNRELNLENWKLNQSLNNMKMFVDFIHFQINEYIEQVMRVYDETRMKQMKKVFVDILQYYRQHRADPPEKNVYSTFFQEKITPQYLSIEYQPQSKVD